MSMNTRPVSGSKSKTVITKPTTSMASPTAAVGFRKLRLRVANSISYTLWGSESCRRSFDRQSRYGADDTF